MSLNRAAGTTGMVWGVASGAATLGVAELVAGFAQRSLPAGATASPLLAIGAEFVDRTPPWLKDWAVATFGTGDKIALFVGIGLVLALLTAAIGVLAVRRAPAAILAWMVLGLTGTLAVVTGPGNPVLLAAPTVLGTLAGVATLLWGAARIRGHELRPESRQGTEGGQGTKGGQSNDREQGNDRGPGKDPTRRLVLLGGVGLTIVSALGIWAGRAISRAEEVGRRIREAFPLPRASNTVSVPSAAEATVAGQTSYISPNNGFYRIDTALSVPGVDPTDWSLRVHGMVDREVTMTMSDLLAEQHVEALVTLTCVSNQVGGNLAGNARWLGWPVRELLARAGVSPDADMVLSRSVDGWTAGTPLEALTDERNALLAVGMNGEPLPQEHGFPVRLVVPGLYGYVSATKWVTELKVTRFDADEGYWTPRGWSALGPIKVASRIDVPRAGNRIDAGEVMVAGVAWAQQRGIEAVEVRVDQGPWRTAELAAQPSEDAWRLWSYRWDATPGDHELQVRAVAGGGEVQTGESADPAPNGASGWHRVDVSAS